MNPDNINGINNAIIDVNELQENRVVIYLHNGVINSINDNNNSVKEDYGKSDATFYCKEIYITGDNTDELQNCKMENTYNSTVNYKEGIEHTNDSQHCKDIYNIKEDTDEFQSYTEIDNICEYTVKAKYFDIYNEHNYFAKNSSVINEGVFHGGHFNDFPFKSNIDINSSNEAENLEAERNMNMDYFEYSRQEIEAVDYSKLKEPLYKFDANKIFKQCSKNDETENVKVENSIENNYFEFFSHEIGANALIDSFIPEGNEVLLNYQYDVAKNMIAQFSNSDKITIFKVENNIGNDIKEKERDQEIEANNIIHNSNTKENGFSNNHYDTKRNIKKQINGIIQTENAATQMNIKIDYVEGCAQEIEANKADNNFNWDESDFLQITEIKEENEMKFGEISNAKYNYDTNSMLNKQSNEIAIKRVKCDSNSEKGIINSDIISISSDEIIIQEDTKKELDNSDVDGYHSSDFEFIDEKDAVKEGLILNINPSSRIFSNFAKNVEIKDICTEFNENTVIYDYFSSLKPNNEMVEHRIPTDDEFNSLFQGHFVPFPMNSIENKAIRPQSSKHMQYAGIGFDMQSLPCVDDETEERKKEAKLTAKKIRSMYPSENSERYLQRYYY